MIQVFPIGSTVRIGFGSDKIQGTVTAIMIEDAGNVSYKVAWWDGRNRKAEWLERPEVFATADGEETLRIGFKVAA